jgi:hypothetical protein
VDALDLPLGFEMSAYVYGLDISYELPLKMAEISLMRKKMLKKIKRGEGSTSMDRSSSAVSLMNKSSFNVIYINFFDNFFNLFLATNKL